MNKDRLAQELKEKIKEGIKPSDLKKKGNINPQIPTPPSSPTITPIDKKVGIGWNNKKELEQLEQKKIRELEQSVKFWSTTADNYLKSLQKLTAELDQKEQKIKDQNKTISDLDYLLKTGKNSEIVKKLESKIKEQEKTVEELKKQVKNTDKTKQQLFTCYHCQKEQQISLLVLELPEGKLCQLCWQILRKKTKEQIKPTITPFTCHSCQETKQEKEYKVKLDASLIEYPTCSLCLPLIKEYNEKEQDSQRELDIWE